MPFTSLRTKLIASFVAVIAVSLLLASGTFAYLVRRAWRFLRRVGVQLPATYADTAVDFLCRYPDDTNWPGTWVANHVFFHESKQYGRRHFHFDLRQYPSPGQLKDRAYPELWKRSPRPLFTLLERARADAVCSMIR